jgi:hypothetical protein
MQTGVAVRKPSVPIPVLSLLIALAVVFALGGISGYVAKAWVTPSGETRQHAVVSAAQALCPSGSHLAVWYTARVLTCAAGVSGP